MDVAEYLAALPEERRAATIAIRKVIKKNLDGDYEEGILYGMLSYFVPHRVFPKGYHCDPKKPLMFIGLASKKAYMALHMVCFYCQPELRDWFNAQYKKSGKKLDMGAGCLRFKTLPDLALDVVEQTLARLPPAKYASSYQAVRDAMGKGKNKPKAAAKKAAPARKAAPVKKAKAPRAAAGRKTRK